MPRFYTGWSYGEMDRILRFENAQDFEKTPNLEDNTLDLEDSLTYGDDVLPLEGDAVSLEDYNTDLAGNFWDRKKNSIFLLSKQISGEALDILYGDNIFKLQLHGEDEYYLEKEFAEGNRQRIRYLLLIARPMGVSYRSGVTPNTSLWSSILPTLKGLRIVAEQPVEAPSYHGAPSLEQEIDCWVKWIKPFLQCFGQYLLKDTIVQVDIDGRAETRELVKECLPHGFREIRCRHVGDLIFKRGRFSWESGYWDDDDYVNSRDADGDWGSD